MPHPSELGSQSLIILENCQHAIKPPPPPACLAASWDEGWCHTEANVGQSFHLQPPIGGATCTDPTSDWTMYPESPEPHKMATKDLLHDALVNSTHHFQSLGERKHCNTHSNDQTGQQCDFR